MPKKIEIKKFGDVGVLEYVDYELDKDVEPGCVRIKHTSIGVNYIDTYHRTGLYPVDVPMTLGLEAVGVVASVGGGVTEFVVGDRVGYASIPLGAYSEIRDYPAKKLFKVPDFLDDDDAASILLKGMTVEYLFKRTFNVSENQFVLFHAAAGGVGLVACQWARALGCRLIGTVGSKEKADLAKKNGCEYIINYKEENVVEVVNEITGGAGVPVVYDGVGRDTFEASLGCLSKRGMLVSFGQSSGMVPSINLHKVFSPKNLFYTRPSLIIYNEKREDLLKSSSDLFKMIELGKIKTNIYKKYKLEDVAKAHKELQMRKTSGSLVLKP